ncbi:equilibrative nucleotide transporter 1-like protein, partial [Trifolium pratense]
MELDSELKNCVVGLLSGFIVWQYQPISSSHLISGVLVSFLRIFTKAVYTQDVHDKLPIMKYYDEAKIQAVAAEEDNGPLTGSVWRSTVWDTVGTIKWYGFGMVIIYVVTLAIFPGYITEDVHSELLKDWYPILLITCFNVFDLVGKS